jgi:hypothetical protein
MPIQEIFPNSDLNSGIKSLLSNQYMLAFFKRFCNAVQSRMWKFRKARNLRYKDIDHLQVFFFSEVMGRSILDASEFLNDYLLGRKRGRRKRFADGRTKRVVPHQTDVNKYLRRIGLEKARNILRECLDAQLKEALELNIIAKKVSVLIDFTEHAYYGKRDDILIKGTNRQKGTKKMRHYLNFSILSREVQLFAGLEHIATGQSKIPTILKFLDSLLALGFELNYVIMDREFYRAELLDEIKGMKGNVLIPAKSYKKIKQSIEEYLAGKKGRVIRYMFSTTTNTRYKFFQNVYLILHAKKGYSLNAVKREYQKGILPLKDARRRVFTIMTTEKPKGKASSWASRVSLFYRKRWLIETGFSDLNRINRRWKSNHDNVRYLDLLARMLLYNSWKINKSLIKKHAKKENTTRDWTLIQNMDCLKRDFLLMEKKSWGALG